MRSLAILVIFCLFLPNCLSAEIFEFGGYEIWLTCRQKGDRLFLEGRLSYGEPCRTARVDALVENTQGERKRVQIWVKDAGGFGSRLLGSDVRVKGRDGTWQVVDAEVKCVSRK